MAPVNPPYSILRWVLQLNKTKREGFTLTELLISVVVGSIVVASMLYLVVELFGVNAREESLTQTQQDMQRALNYINRDASEAVFVYATPDVDGVTDDIWGQILEDGAIPDDAVPILAFWRLDPIDISGVGDCDDFTSQIQQQECETLKVRHNVYTLVVYLQQANNGTDIWEGPSRILRYELTKYKDIGDLEQRDGYSDPSLPPNSFESWLKAADETPDGSVDVLTDYVDFATIESAPCPSDVYTRTPAPDTNDDTFGSFYACVLNGSVEVGTDLTARTNQSLVLYLTGNALSDFEDNERLIFGPTSEASRTPTLQSEVLIRGVLEEQFN
jgi:prepilin-type N-terminal cleavage/methylation domain-containing protein